MARKISPARRAEMTQVAHEIEVATYDEQLVPACQGRTEFADYKTPRDKHLGGLRIECIETCKLVQICQRNARVNKPAWGIWGGDVWENGRIVNVPL